MNILAELQERFRAALAELVDDPTELLAMVRKSSEPKFGDYQANFAMALGKRLKRPPRDVAAEIVQRLQIDDLCEPPEVAGPGFINLRLKTDWLAAAATRTLASQRLGVTPAKEPRTYVVDYSSPNVAKPMHVGHIRSSVIGDSLKRTLRFLGHKVIADNHIGDWGTQFGMIIYGYKHFLDEAAYRQNAVAELGRLYKFVSRLVSYREAVRSLPEMRNRLAERRDDAAHLASVAQERSDDKGAAKAARKAEAGAKEQAAALQSLEAGIAEVESDPVLSKAAAAHPDIEKQVLEETAKLHRGDAENVSLWKEFLPACLEDIQRIYRRLDVSFDVTLGESFYNDRLPGVVNALVQRDIARESDGAMCVFLDDHKTPLVIRKQDGAFLYGTTDLATVQYRMETWHPDAMLYVVDHRQSLHFEQFFAAARLWGYDDVEMVHVSFGTVLGEDGRPFKTRSGDTVGLEGLLDEAVRRAYEVVSENDDKKPGGAEIEPERRREIAEVVGIGALKYADLSVNRTSDYTFSYDRMLALNGNTATYMQYAYARVFGSFAKGDIDVQELRASGAAIDLSHPAERALAVGLLQFFEALEAAAAEYRPNLLTTYLFDVAGAFSIFFDQCPVLKAETEELRTSRLLLCDLTARTLKQGLDLLGIKVVDKM
ncbi:MAG: arginine--tRNA ligase [Planctomycetota bacterium]|nr:MAG: arginine--tRNA ligase [Planctomycetota bacterium]